MNLTILECVSAQCIAECGGSTRKWNRHNIFMVIHVSWIYVREKRVHSSDRRIVY